MIEAEAPAVLRWISSMDVCKLESTIAIVDYDDSRPLVLAVAIMLGPMRD